MTTAPASDLPSLVERMIRIEVKLDTYNSNHSDHETRLRKVERNMYLMAGVALIGGGGIGSIVTQLLGGS